MEVNQNPLCVLYCIIAQIRPCTLASLHNVIIVIIAVCRVSLHKNHLSFKLFRNNNNMKIAENV